MKAKNVHGLWTLTFENRLLYSKVDGAINSEASEIWFKEMNEMIRSSREGFDKPWVALIDARDWELAPPDFWEATNFLVNWMSEHNCLLYALIFSNKVQRFAVEQGFNNQPILQYFFDYDEAFQICLDKLKEVEGPSMG